MNFSELFQFNPYFDLKRRERSMQTFSNFLEGVSVDDFKPSPLKCKCDHFPQILRSEDNIFTAMCQSADCNNDFKGSAPNYQKIILLWNASKSSIFDYKKNRVHPLVKFSLDSDTLIFYEHKINKCIEKVNSLLSNKLSKKEERLVNLFEDWNNFALKIISRFKGLDDISEEPSEKVKLGRQKLPIMPFVMKGPMTKYSHQVQFIGNAYYWFVDNHLIPLKVCSSTGMTIPMFVVHIKNKGLDPNFQVRIDLRSLKVPYFSKLCKGVDEKDSLDKALDVLKEQLSKIPYFRRDLSIINRGKLSSSKAVSMNDITNIGIISRTEGGRLIMTLPSANEQSNSRYGATIGAGNKLSYKVYCEEIKRLVKYSILHAKYATSLKHSVGGLVKFSDLNPIDQKNVIYAISDEIGFSFSEVLIPVMENKAKVYIGYLPISSLRNDCVMSLDNEDAPMQIISSRNREGYVNGKVKRNDHLKNVECLNIDSILNSNIKQCIMQEEPPALFLGESFTHIMLSIRALDAIELASKGTPYKVEKIINIPKPIELIYLYHKFSIDEFTYGNKLKLPSNRISLKLQEDVINLFEGEIKLNRSISLEDWHFDLRAATLQMLICYLNIRKHSKGPLFNSRTLTRNRNIKYRYESLNITPESCDLANVRFIPPKRTIAVLTNISLFKNRILYRKKPDIYGSKTIRKNYSEIFCYEDFLSAIKDAYKDMSEFNNDELKYLSIIYKKFISL